MTQPAQPTLSIIIVNWNTADLLDACLKSVFQYTRRLDFEVIVFDNHSSDHTREVLKKYPNVTAIFHPENLGFAAGNNAALPHASGEYLLLLNPDTELTDNAFPDMINWIKDCPCDIIAPRLRLPDNSIQVSSGNFPRLKTVIFQNLFLLLERWGFFLTIPALSRVSGIPPGAYLGNEKLWPSDKVHSVDWVSGACFLLRTDDFRDVGGFDETFVLYGEEFDLCRRLADKGKKACYFGLAEIIHHSGASIREFREKSYVLHFIASLRYFRKHRPAWEVYCYRWGIILSCSGKIVWEKLWQLLISPNAKAQSALKIRAYQQLINVYLKNRLDEALPEK